MNAKEIKIVKEAIDREYSHMKQVEAQFGDECNLYKLVRRGFVKIIGVAKELGIDYVPEED